LIAEQLTADAYEGAGESQPQCLHLESAACECDGSIVLPLAALRVGLPSLSAIVNVAPP
jgi:hypothetical protein